MPTDFPLNDPLAVQRFSTSLGHEAYVDQYFHKFMGTGERAMIKLEKDLAKKAGESITVGLAMKLTGDGTEGDDTIEGTAAEEGITFFNDKVYIDQRRKGTKSKGKMSEQRVPYNLRKVGLGKLKGWFAEDYDQQIFCYLSGARGINTFHFNTAWTGRANNNLDAPDTAHIVHGGNATGKADMEVSDKMSRVMAEKVAAKIDTLEPQMLPFRHQGKDMYVLLMHPFQAYDLRNSTSSGDWLDIQQAAAGRGKDNPIFRGSLGELAGLVLHKHRFAIQFNDYGATADLPAARALCLGAQAGMIAWGGDGGKNRYSWNEETDDRGNQLAITAGSIYGIKKSRYNGKDYGVIAADTYTVDPN